MKQIILKTKFISLLVLFILFSKSIFADSLVSINELTYHSKFEEQVFNKLGSGDDIDYFALFLCANKSVNQSVYDNYKVRFENSIEMYKQSPYQKMKQQILH